MPCVFNATLRSRDNTRVRMKPKLSVITACFMHAKFLQECIDSVLTQTESDIEHVLIDDASPDDSWAIMQAAEEANPSRVRILAHTHNAGLSASQNYGISMTRAPWVLKVDADDYISPTYVEEILAAAAEDGSRNVIFSPARVFGNGYSKVYRYPPFNAATMIDTFMIPGPSAIRRDVWDAVGGYDETMRSAEDWDLYIRAQLAVGLVPHQLSEARWHYRQHDGTRASEHGMRRLTHLRRYWREHTRESVLNRSRTWGAWCAERGLAA